MKKSICLTGLLAAASLVLTLTSCSSTGGSNDSEPDDAATLQAVMSNIMSRTSIRAYTNQPVEDEKIEQMIAAAMAAPSAGNKQPWRFVVVRDRAVLDSIAAHFRTIRMADKAPLAIVVCGDMNDTFDGDGLDYWVEDTSAATENLLLAAHALGLGAVWCGIYPMQERVAYLSRLLHLPPHIVPLNVVPIGYPAEDPEPKDKWKPEHIQYDYWGNTLPAESYQGPETKPAAWEKVHVAQLKENAFTLFPEPLALTVGSDEKMNSMTIGWGGLGVLWGRPVVTVYVEERRYTRTLMETNDYFTVTAFPKGYEEALHYLGTVSGRDEDKIAGSGLTLKKTEMGSPAFEEGRLILECKKIYGAPFNPDGFGEVARKVYSDRPLHTIYVGEVVNAYIKQ